MRVGVAVGVILKVVVLVMIVMVMMVEMADGLEQEERHGDEHTCEAQGQCRECIQIPECVWCIWPKADMRNCQRGATINMTSFCDPRDLRDPQNEVNVLENQPLTEIGRAKEDTPEDIIQMQPQRVKLRLRKGVPQRLSIKFRRARAYPVDLYYLMDLSYSMKDDKNNLANVSKVLADTLHNLTDQFTIGFGSFVDKVMMPFTDMSAKMLKSPCENCSSPYSFRNDLKLTRNHEMFRRKVEEAKISGNLDSPEGGFDALMQAMVCTEQIGWRNVSRRILVFSTDAKFHHAGYGRLAGIVTPNDEQCHLSPEGEYMAYDKFDYPSVSQINKVAKEKNINVIFAVLAYREIYESLSNEIETSSFGMLEEGSLNVVDLIREQYKNISSEVSLSDNSTEDVSIVYSSTCQGGPVTKTNKCGGIQENDEVTFHLEITANKCPADGKGSIVEVKTLEEGMILDLEYHCSCDCPVDENKSKCKNRGNVVCGVCDCSPGYYGEKCQCGGDESSFGFSEDQNKRCMASDKDTTLCSGRGICKCGECICKNANVTGKYCQCDRRQCLQYDVLCSGRGVCECGKCKCDPGYAGKFCDCPDDETCKQPGSSKVCSGHGECACGKCKCSSQANDTFTGKYCEDCLRCGTSKCSQFKDCVMCVHFGKGPRKHDCNSCEKSELVDTLDELVFKGALLCTFEDEDGCYGNFTYRYLENQNRDEVFVQADLQCQEPPAILSIVFSLISAIVAVGLLTLIIWKIVTTIHDRREFTRFEKEIRNAQFNSEENPLYRSAATTVQNPVFLAQHK